MPVFDQATKALRRGVSEILLIERVQSEQMETHNLHHFLYCKYLLFEYFKVLGNANSPMFNFCFILAQY